MEEEIKKCPHCGKELSKRKRNIYCSSECYLAELNLSSFHRSCIVCGTEFRVSPTTNRLCCSPKCSQIRRAEIAASETGKKSTDDMRVGFSEYLKNIGEGHHMSKHYLIRDPQNRIIDVTNLRRWVYSNNLFESPDHAYDNLKRISGTLQGTSNRAPQYSYKGWSIIHVDDGNRTEHKKQVKICTYCGKEINTPHSIRYCSDECRINARRERQRKPQKENHND